MAYESYTDTNRVTWTIAPPSGVSWYMLAYVADDAQMKYDPAPSDVMASMPPPATYGDRPPPHPTAEQQRVIFTELVQKIEQYATMNRSHVALQVTAHSNNWMALVAIGIILYELADRPRGASGRR